MWDDRSQMRARDRHNSHGFHGLRIGIRVAKRAGMPRTAAFVAALVGLAGPALADAPAMRLGDIVAQAVQHNPTLLEAGADLGVAEGNLLNAEGLNDFHIDASGFYRRDQTQIIPGNPTQLPSHEDWNGQLDLSQPLPIGGSIGLRFVADYTTNVFAELTGTGS